MKFKAGQFKALIRVLEKEAKKPTKGFEFNMNNYGTQNHCGTTACAMGTGVIRGVFPGVTGKWIKFTDSNGKPYHRLYPKRGRTEVAFGYLGTNAFGISCAEYSRLFTSGSATGRTLRQQIAYMKKFLARKTAQRAAE